MTGWRLSLFRVMLTVLMLCWFATSYVLRDYVDIGDVFSVYEGLRNSASIIFGVMGAWVAIVYPRFLTKLISSVDPDIKKMESEADHVRKLFRPLLWATVVLAVSLLVDLGEPFFIFDRSRDNVIMWAKVVSMSLAGLLTSLMLYTVILTLLPINEALREINKRIDKMTSGEKL